MSAAFRSAVLKRICHPPKAIHTRLLHPFVPPEPVGKPTDESKLPPRTKIDQQTIDLLERLSLVDFANKKGIERLEQAIRFADQIQLVDTTGVEPLVTVLEDRPLFLREDSVTDGNCREEVMANAAMTEEEYFVAPPGNIPLTPRKSVYEEERETAEQQL